MTGIAVALFLTAVVAAVMCMRQEDKSPSEHSTRTAPSISQEQKREAHYMRNFWNYDGSEQQEWDA